MGDDPVESDLGLGVACGPGGYAPHHTVPVPRRDLRDTLGKRTVGHDGDLVLLAIGDQVTLDFPVHQTVQDLVGDDLSSGERCFGFLELSHGEVADPNVTNLPFFD